MIDYSTIKQLAAEQGIRVQDLCALAPKNDPFYVGRPAEIAAGEWFAELWAQFGYQNGVHLRRMHYRIVSQDSPVRRPDGQDYQNTQRDWNYLNEASKSARYLNLVSPTAFIDRRNPEAIIHAYYPRPDDWNYLDPTPDYNVTGEWGEDNDSDYELPELPELPGLPGYLPAPPDYEVSGYEGIQQPNHIEIWCEKTTMNDILSPLARRYGINLITGAGELSITAVVDFMRRASAAERPARILYISDFDPAGLGMPISIARKIEYFQRNEGFDDLDVRLHPIVLTAGQVDHFNLPRVPVKDTDLRKAHFEAAYGQGQVELDALEALYPGQLAQIVRDAIFQYHDPDLTSRAEAQREALRETLTEERLARLDDYRDDLSELETEYNQLADDFETVRDEFAALVVDFQPRIDEYKERLENIKTRARTVYGDLAYALGLVDLDLGETFALPDPGLPEETETLYDSRRDYVDQLLSYKNLRHGLNGQGEEHAH